MTYCLLFNYYKRTAFFSLFFFKLEKTEMCKEGNKNPMQACFSEITVVSTLLCEAEAKNLDPNLPTCSPGK